MKVELGLQEDHQAAVYRREAQEVQVGQEDQVAHHQDMADQEDHHQVEDLHQAILNTEAHHQVDQEEVHLQDIQLTGDHHQAHQAAHQEEDQAVHQEEIQTLSVEDDDGQIIFYFTFSL